MNHLRIAVRVAGTFALIYILAGAPTGIAAQEPSSFDARVRVRVTALDCGLREQATGFQALREGMLVLDATECPLASVTRLEVSRGQKSNAGLGASIGFGAGALGTVFYCKALDQFGCRLFDDDLTLPVALIVGAIGAIAGGITGNLIKSERWEEVSLERVSVSLAPQRDGRFGLGLTVKF